MTTIRAIGVIVALALISLVLIPLQLIAMALKMKTATRRLPLLWHRLATRVIGIRVHVHGAATAERPLLLVSNHVSWLDITVLGSVMELCFISKSEVAAWPIFGLFAKLQRSVFVERDRRHKTGTVANEIADRLKDGDVLVLFAEGTSSNGIHVLPFRTALIGGAVRAAEAGGAEVTIQPLAINYTQLHGLPIGRFHKPRVAWYGDMDMPPHLWWILKHGEIDVDVAFGAPIPLREGIDRKRAAKEAEAVVRHLVGEATAGRLVRGAPVAPKAREAA
ncbi:lysophospholipid acyltransferase family protein [Acuticoccus kandeliae]|uniref:lysophospholipid acyltransferase family protein n=1 Tax=Acuticoccus kandeliae TaxID=2073160 RepID=UPI001FE7DBCA|nr:lysophospholipid acyltransferase family protein [Acuticoccus kandeliae]